MKKIALFLLVAGIAALVFSSFTVHPSYAQTYPSQPIQMIITLAPGDTLDLTGRAISTEMSKILKSPVVAVNKTGGAGTAGADFVAKGKKDGYSLLYINSNIIYSYANNPADVPYNPFQDFEPVCQAVSVPLLLAVQAEAPWKTFQELVSTMKQNPGKIRGSSTGVGSVGHFGYEVIRLETGGEISMIPFKGAVPGLTALLGGHVEVAIPSYALVSPQLKAGKVRILLSSKKLPEYPQIPTLTQLGFKRDMSSVWFGFFLPTGVPDDVKKTLIPALEKSLKAPDVVKAIQNLGALEDYKPAAEYKKAMTDEYTIVKNLLKTAAPPSK
ncbi:MAG: tripartite tricarboxylate transporter substrate binding protein [Deltaproteobacteria bacterium]